MTQSERIRNLESLGYSHREADFLSRAALVSGYFVRRQYSDATGAKPGKADQQFIDKITAGDAKELPLRPAVYHITGPMIYEACGDPYNRNRKLHELPIIRGRLIGLDYVLENERFPLLLSQWEKVSYFRGGPGIPTDFLPAKSYATTLGSQRQYFVEKFPIFVRAEMPLFTYIDEGQVTEKGFETFLARYEPLFTRLESFELIYISPHPHNLERGRRVFDKWGFRHSTDHAVNEIVAHFEDREALERRDVAKLNLARYRSQTKRFSGSEWDDLYSKWKQSGRAPVAEKCAGQKSFGGVFVPHLATWRYGTLEGRPLVPDDPPSRRRRTDMSTRELELANVTGD